MTTRAVMAARKPPGSRPGLTLRDQQRSVRYRGGQGFRPVVVPLSRYGAPVHVVRGLRQALLMVAGSAVVALAGAGLWTGWQGGDFREPATGGALTAVGIFLFVSVPLFLVGALLYGSG